MFFAGALGSAAERAWNEYLGPSESEAKRWLKDAWVKIDEEKMRTRAEHQRGEAYREALVEARRRYENAESAVVRLTQEASVCLDCGKRGLHIHDIPRTP